MYHCVVEGFRRYKLKGVLHGVGGEDSMHSAAFWRIPGIEEKFKN